MTPKQRTLYFRLWAQVARVHGWRMLGGRLVGTRAGSWGGPAPTALYQAVWEVAEDLAPGRVTPDDLRHAVTAVATGEVQSSAGLSNREFDRVLAVLRLLANPDDLEAMLEWQDTEGRRGRRLRQEWTLRRAPVGYVRTVAGDKTGTKGWEGLDDERVNQLHMTIQNRSPRPASSGQPLQVSEPVRQSPHPVGTLLLLLSLGATVWGRGEVPLGDGGVGAHRGAELAAVAPGDVLTDTGAQVADPGRGGPVPLRHPEQRGTPQLGGQGSDLHPEVPPAVLGLDPHGEPVLPPAGGVPGDEAHGEGSEVGQYVLRHFWHAMLLMLGWFLGVKAATWAADQPRGFWRAFILGRTSGR